MHSLVVLGDCRRHDVTIDPGAWKTVDCGTKPAGGKAKFLGGTYFLLEAISSLLNGTEVFSYVDSPMNDEDALSYSEAANWSLVPTKLSKIANAVARLRPGNVVTYPVGFPPVSRALLEVLACNDGQFEPVCRSVEFLSEIVFDAGRTGKALGPSVIKPFNSVKSALEGQQHSRNLVERLDVEIARINKFSGELGKARDEMAKLFRCEGSESADFKEAVNAFEQFVTRFKTNYWQVCTCPDVVAIDDLDLGFRSLRLPLRVSRDGHSLELDAAEIAEQLVVINEEMANGETSPDRTSVLRAVLTLLVERMARSHQQSKAWKNLPMLEPLIVASIAESAHNIFSDELDADTAEETFWSVIYKYQWMRERTVLVISADDLRACGLPISSGLSWERTVQDAIIELKRSSKFRKFFDFGQIVVRFGVTGALQIVKSGPSDWSYTLFFLPENDDAMWSPVGSDNIVLGAGAITVASIIESVSNLCETSGGHPLLSDASAAVGEGISEAISRCFTLASKSYGSRCATDFIEMTSQNRRIPIEVLKMDVSDKFGSVVAPDNNRSNELLQTRIATGLPKQISVSAVPPISSKDWSILGQSVHTRIGQVARELVYFGAANVLNQPKPGDNRIFLSRLRRKIFDNIQNEMIRFCKGIPADRFSKADLRPRVRQVVRMSLLGTLGDTQLYGCRTHIAQRALLEAPTTESQDWLKFVELTARSVVECLNSAEDVSKLTRSLEECGAIWQIEQHLAAVATALGTVNPGSVGPVVAPIIRFSSSPAKAGYLVIDRNEIEGTRSIEKLMRSHINGVREGRIQRPLSIAVFGPPGSGKSMAVKSINESLDGGSTEILEPVNLSQLVSIDELDKAFEKINSKGGGTSVPIVFFDEFDSSSPDGQPLGWLKYFLAPMEDGVFRGKSIKNAVLVFAGGTKTTFNDFSLAGRSRNDSQWITFSDAKGPDFVSRLRGHLNIIGINPADPNDELYLIRRALLIRSLLSSMQELADGERARIDQNMLRAVLHVPTYLHGARALRMLLELSATGRNRQVSASSVPPVNQLNMLVDGKAFIDLLNNVAATG